MSVLSHYDKMQLAQFCYPTNNRFAYKYDRDNKIPEDELKCYNFVPTYDKWCLYCDNKFCSLSCSQCKFVYFCDKECQRKSWKIHKTHCKRNLFTLCITCGSTDIKIKCENCNVHYCSNKCKNDLHSAHIDYDCNTFNKINLS